VNGLIKLTYSPSRQDGQLY